MEKKILSIMLVIAVIASIFTVPVFANSKITESNYTLEVDGVKSSVRSISVDGKRLFAINDVAKALMLTVKQDTKAKKVTVTGKELEMVLTGNSKTVLVNGVKKDTAYPVQDIKSIYYVSLEILTEQLGYFSALSDNTMTLSKLLTGVSRIVQWVGAAQVMVEADTENGQEYYIVNIDTAKFDKVIGNELNATEAACSPDGGKSIAYINDNGDIFVLNTDTKASKKVSSDDSIKCELQWSKAGDALYYISGDKSDVISKIQLADEKTVKVLGDKVNYKSDLKVSATGKGLLYTVTKDGKVTGNDEKDIAVDTSNTEPQIFAYDTTAVDAKPVQLTYTKDNKVYGDFAGSKGYFYISFSTDNDSSKPVIKLLSNDAKETVVIPTDLTIIQSAALNGKAVLLATDTQDKKGIYDYDISSYSIKKICDVPASVNKISVSEDGKSVAAELSSDNGTVVTVLNQSKFINITK